MLRAYCILILSYLHLAFYSLLRLLKSSFTPNQSFLVIFIYVFYFSFPRSSWKSVFNYRSQRSIPYTLYHIPYIIHHTIYIISYHTIPYQHTVPAFHTIYHTIPYHTIPYHTIPYYTILYHTIPYQHTVPAFHTSIPYHNHTIPYRTSITYQHSIPYTIPYHTIPYNCFLPASGSTILFSSKT